MHSRDAEPADPISKNLPDDVTLKPVRGQYELDAEVVYTLRIRGNRFRPKVFREGKYTIRVGRPEDGRLSTLRAVSATADNREVIDVSF